MSASLVPEARLVLLGASNLLLSLPLAISEARRVLPSGPLEILVAAGHGRSYGAPTRVGYRRLAGILGCDLWQRLHQGEAQGIAVLTDIGNDLAYGHAPDRIAGWVDEALDRLRSAGLPAVITRLPVASLERLGPFRFWVVSRLLFPESALARRETLEAAVELDERLVRLASRSGVVAVTPDPGWFGPDRIHLKPGCWRQAWRFLFGSFAVTEAEPGPRLRWWRTVLAPPRRRWCFGRERQHRQPARLLSDGSSLFLY